MFLIFSDIFWDKSLKKLDKKIFWTVSSLCVLNFLKYFLIYILEQNVSKKLGKKDFELYQVFMCRIVLNIFLHIFWTKLLKKLDRKNVWTISSLHVYFFWEKWQDVQKIFWAISSLYVTSFFSSSDMKKPHHLLECHAIGINSSLIFF